MEHIDGSYRFCWIGPRQVGSVSAALDPWCIAQPQTAQDVSAILTVLIDNSCPFGVRGGGHGSWHGSNSVSQGVTIDFGFMNTTTYNSTSNIVSVAPAGALAGTVGAGGFLLEDGDSFHSASHGMSCDRIQNFEFVLANGSIMNANVDDNPDLWLALKGGSANFGLITRFAIESPNTSDPVIWGGLLEYELALGDAVLDAMVTFNDNVPDDQNTLSIVYWAYTSTAGGMVPDVALENTLAEASPAATDVYLNISGITSNTLRKVDLTTITHYLGAGEPPGYCDFWYTLLLPNSAEVMKYAAKAHENAVKELAMAMTAAASEFCTFCMFQPLNNLIVQHGADKGGNVLGLDATLDGANEVLFLATLAVKGEGKEAGGPAHNAELDGLGGHDPLSSAGPEAIAKMWTASAKYDPGGVFQSLGTTGFKILNMMYD
ncbi:FAD-binding domain-containing protein [Cryphonectria parasitica EP155]|uniref:FAD-binding domain-containing protein n=1 Tax=Cryphonectria parasitica (strain ATCC 38755 / EP155) TaxID=660469 RepID=A0A9P5CND7_CRYP1|nr:FAD-binding domain-containing protein [Cryphonectria parasitica EP155]KAF3765349.1 FAD-binding domain-containing protein [Cryphonectria parasitica EP155]